MRILIDAVGLKGQGGAVALERLMRSWVCECPGWNFEIALYPASLRDWSFYFEKEPVAQIKPIIPNVSSKWMSRLGWLGWILPRIGMSRRYDLIFSFANLTPIWSTVPIVLFFQQSNVFFADPIKWSIKNWFRHNLLKRLIYWSVKRADIVIVQTSSVRRDLNKYCKYSIKKCAVIPIGITITSDIRNSLRSKKNSFFPLSGAKISAFYPAYPYPHKNHIRLIEAWSRVVEAYPQAQLCLTIAKDYDSGSRFPSEIAEIYDRAVKRRLQNNIIFAGELEPDVVRYLLRCSEWMVFPSLRESLGIPLYEAMKEGCPIIAANEGYVRLNLGDAAVYFDGNDYEDMAKVLIYCIGNSEVRKIQKGKLEEALIAWERINIGRELAEECRKMMKGK